MEVQRQTFASDTLLRDGAAIGTAGTFPSDFEVVAPVFPG